MTLPTKRVAALLLACTAAAVPASAAEKTLPTPQKNSHPLETAVVDPTTFTGRTAAAALTRTRSAGATYVRLSLDWRQIAPQRPAKPTDPDDPAYRWTRFETELGLALSRNLEPIVTVTGAAPWARRRARANPKDFADFALAAATRYARVRYWHAWNEPNHPGRANLKKGAAAWYRELVNRFATAVHSANQANQVIAGGTSPFTTKTTVGPLLFMRRLFAERVSFDIWSHHPYTSGGPTHQANGKNDASLGDLPEMASLLRRAQTQGKIASRRKVRFWVTEFAWDTSPPDPKAVPLGLQARWTAEALYRMWAAGVSLVAWWRIRDDPLKTSFYQSGLYFRGASIGQDRPKRTLYAFRFPFVAFAEQGRVFVWGRTPAGKPGRVTIEQSSSGAWKKLGAVRTDRYGIFSRRYATENAGPLRARLPATNDVSVPFALDAPPDRFYYPFGS